MISRQGTVSDVLTNRFFIRLGLFLGNWESK
jgi:hypothetical protein